jgi:CDP-diacylglycerol--serine O-phosphatidyltransferase
MPALRYFVPNTFTALSLLIGLWSVVMSVRGHFELAAWAILWGTLLDKADGTAARLFKATSRFGVEFDSFADFVIFGIAPAALVYFRLSALGGYAGWREALLMGAAGLHVLALAVRLSRFNVTTGAEKVFYGIPGTLIGALLAAGYLTCHEYRLDPELLRYAPACLVVGALLMVSSLRIPKLGVRKSKALNLFQFGNVAAAYVLGPLMLFPQYLFALAAVYTVGGVVVCLIRPEPVEAKPQGQLA